MLIQFACDNFHTKVYIVSNESKDKDENFDMWFNTKLKYLTYMNSIIEDSNIDVNEFFDRYASDSDVDSDSDNDGDSDDGLPSCEVCSCFKEAENYTPCCHVPLCDEHFKLYPMCSIENCKYNYSDEMCFVCININAYMCEKCETTFCDHHNTKNNKCKCK
jgi:hypothetical protein